MITNRELLRRDKLIAEIQAKALLLGMSYDARDHTFCRKTKSGKLLEVLDADTMEPLTGWTQFQGLKHWHSNILGQRAMLVGQGKLGIQI